VSNIKQIADIHQFLIENKKYEVAALVNIKRGRASDTQYSEYESNSPIEKRHTKGEANAIAITKNLNQILSVKLLIT
jgi:hypothetical protein